jgi:hypothetical protein
VAAERAAYAAASEQLQGKLAAALGDAEDARLALGDAQSRAAAAAAAAAAADARAVGASAAAAAAADARAVAAAAAAAAETTAAAHDAEVAARDAEVKTCKARPSFDALPQCMLISSLFHSSLVLCIRHPHMVSFLVSFL